MSYKRQRDDRNFWRLRDAVFLTRLQYIYDEFCYRNWLVIKRTAPADQKSCHWDPADPADQ